MTLPLDECPVESTRYNTRTCHTLSEWDLGIGRGLASRLTRAPRMHMMMMRSSRLSSSQSSMQSRTELLLRASMHTVICA
jgi:hypothetical protein